MTDPPKILVIEDDKQITAALIHTLKSSYTIGSAYSGKDGLYQADGSDYDLVLLDLNLPDMDGLEVCQQLRERGFKSPVCVISGEGSVKSKIALLDTGADDYLTKPFTVGELQARIRVMLRKSPVDAWPDPVINKFGVVIDRKNLSAEREGVKLFLRKKEFEILDCLMSNAGNIVTRRHLLARVWKNSDEIWTNTLDVHMKYLRDKVDRPFGAKLIHTVHGIGYKFELVPAVSNVDRVSASS